MSQSNKANLVMDAPKNWLKMIENIRQVRKKYPAPVDSMGCDQALHSAEKDLDQRFHILVSLMLSSQTKDPVTWAAVQKLKDNGLGSVDAIMQAKEKDIEELIYPVGFYRRKAVYLKKVAAILKEYFNGDIPNDIKGLCALPGVGPKMAHLCMQEAWNVNSGIGVDTHVHRIAARLGWVPTKFIKTPEDTRIALESWMPSEYWREINHLLVGFGQTICTPVNPKCKDCDNNEICPSSNLRKSKASATAKAKPRSKAEPKPKAESEPKAELKPKAEPEPEPEPKAELKPKAEPKLRAEPKPRAEPRSTRSSTRVKSEGDS